MDSDRYSLGEVIAERTLTFTRANGAQKVVIVRLGRPVQSQSQEDWLCPYQIDGPSLIRTFGMYGVDSVQALMLTMRVIRPELEHICKNEGGTISWLDINDSGFPNVP